MNEPGESYPKLTVDAVLFRGGGVVLIRRAHEPHKEEYALPGGFVEIGETVEEACIRETLEETGLHMTNLKLVGVYSDPARDPRRHTISVAFSGDADIAGLRHGSDALSVEIVENWRDVQIAFDHKQIVADAWKQNEMREMHKQKDP